jgi:hypothetical protein
VRHGGIEEFTLLAAARRTNLPHDPVGVVRQIADPAVCSSGHGVRSP